MAAEVDRRGDFKGAGRVLEDDSGRNARTAASAGRSCASRATGLCGCLCGTGAGRGTDGGAESIKPAPWRNVVHDVAGSMGSVAGAPVGAGGYRHLNARVQSRSRRDRRVDRMLCQHTRNASEPVELAYYGRTASAGKSARPGCAAASRHSFRTGSPARPAGAQLVAESVLAGNVLLAKHSCGQITAARAGTEAVSFSPSKNRSVRFDAGPETGEGDHRRRRGG